MAGNDGNMLGFGPTIAAKPGGGVTARGAAIGAVTVSPSSQVGADKWVAMIKSNANIFPWMKDMFTAAGNRIVARQPTRKKTSDTVPEWFESALRAFSVSKWHVTTAASVVAWRTRATSDMFLPDYEANDKPVPWDAKASPGTEVIVGVTISSQFMACGSGPGLCLESHMQDDRAQGPDVPADRVPQEGLVAVSNRFRASVTNGPEQTRNENAMVQTFFHELAAHAGVLFEPLKPGETSEDATKDATHDPVDYKSLPTDSTGQLLVGSKADRLARAVWDFFGQPAEPELDSLKSSPAYAAEAAAETGRASGQAASDASSRAGHERDGGGGS